MRIVSCAQQTPWNREKAAVGALCAKIALREIAKKDTRVQMVLAEVLPVGIVRQRRGSHDEMRAVDEDQTRETAQAAQHTLQA